MLVSLCSLWSIPFKAKVPTLFFSADTDIATVMMRSSAHTASHTQQTVEKMITENPRYYDKYLEEYIAHTMGL
jgi:hypothetical protein